MDDVIKNLYALFDAAFEENMNGRGTDITRMVTTFVPDAIQNLQAYEAIFKNKKSWIDDADAYICPICGFETDNPNRYESARCPKCGFQALIDAIRYANSN